MLRKYIEKIVLKSITKASIFNFIITKINAMHQTEEETRMQKFMDQMIDTKMLELDLKMISCEKKWNEFSCPRMKKRL